MGRHNRLDMITRQRKRNRSRGGWCTALREGLRAEPRQRWHPDVWIDPAQVQSRIAAAVAAGGTLVSDAEAPSFWVLADPQGNRVCLCTWQQRG